MQPSPTPTPTPSAAASPAPKPELDAALLKAAWDDDVAAATELIGQGADVNAKDDTQQSAYLVATSEGYLDLTLANGAVVDDKDSWNGTGLIRAAERGHFLVVGELLRAGIDRDHVNRIGYQAIHEAIWLGRTTRPMPRPFGCSWLGELSSIVPLARRAWPRCRWRVRRASSRRRRFSLPAPGAATWSIPTRP